MRSFRQPKWLVVFNKFDDLAAVRGLLPSREDGCQVLIKARNGDVGRIPEEGFEINDLIGSDFTQTASDWADGLEDAKEM